MRTNDVLPDLDRFHCRRCNECCRQPGFVYLKEPEIQRAAGLLAMSEFDFINTYCDLEERRKLVLKKQPGSEDCIFLSEGGCRIHEAKPDQCREFPRSWRTPRSFEYCEGLKKLTKA